MQLLTGICTIKAQMRNCTTPRRANTRNGLKFLSNYSFVPLCSFSLLLKLKLHWEWNFWEHFYCECTSCLPSLAPSSNSGEEAQVDGLSGNEQRPSFGLHCRCTIFRLDLVMLHQPGQSKVHLHLCHPLPHTGSHPDAERDEAVRVMLVEARPGSVAAAIRRVTAKPPLWEEVLCICELGLIVAGFIMAQMELSLLREPVVIQNHLVLRNKASVSRNHWIQA